jgi:ESF2/ABP1 family protein
MNDQEIDSEKSQNEYESENESLNEEILLDGQGENALVDAENLEDFREKVKRSGIVYMSNIPEGMTVSYLRQRFEQYGVTRIYLAPEGNSNKKKRKYKEGWIEFSEKLFAKLCEYELSGKVIGGKKNIPFREDIWTIKYLHKFKWHHLIEQSNYKKKMREQKMKTELAQARREANFIEENFEKSKIINKKRKLKLIEDENINNNNNDMELKTETVDEKDQRFSKDKFEGYKRNFKQRKPINK